MRAIVVAATAALIFSSANAGGRDREEVYEKCDLVGELAMTIMTGRQTGVPIKTLIEGAPASPLGGVTQEIILWAYEVPELHSDDMKREVSEVFSRKVTADCVQDLLGRQRGE